MAATGKGQWVTLLCFACGVVLHTDVATGLISRGCFGSAGACLDHTLTCSATSRVAIQKALYGHKTEQRCTPGVISCSDPCCSYLPANDCFHTFTAGHVSETYRNCTDHECHFRTPRLVDNCQISTTIYQAVSSYSVVEYECVEDSTIIPMCGTVASVSGQSVSILYDPKKQYMEATDTCWCSLWQAKQNLILVEGLDLRLNSSSGCGSFHMYGAFGNFQHHCFSSPVWPSLTLTYRFDYYSTVKLTGLSEFVWVRFSASSTLYVTCSLNNQHTTTTPSTTTTTTSTTTTTTTTTMTYPTASLPGVITKSPTTVATEASTTSAETTKTSTSSATSTEPTKTSTSSATSTEPTKTSTSSATSTEPTKTSTSSATSAEQMRTNKSLQATTLPTKPSTEARTEDDKTVGAAIGVAVGAVILIIIIVVLLVWCRKIHKERKPETGRKSAIYKDASELSKTNPAFTNATYNGVKIPGDKPTASPATPGTTVVPLTSVITKPGIPPPAPTTTSVTPPKVSTTTSVIPPKAPTTTSVIPPPAPTTTSVIPPPAPTTTSVTPPPAPTTTSVMPPKAPTTTSVTPPTASTTTFVTPPKAPTTTSVIPQTAPTTTSVIPPPAPTTTSVIPPTVPTTTSVIPQKAPTTTTVTPPPTPTTTSVMPPKAPTTTSVIPPTTTTTSVIPSKVSTTPAIKPTTLDTIPENKNVKSPVYDTLKAKGEEHPYSEIKPSTASVKAPGVVGASNAKSQTEMIRM